MENILAEQGLQLTYVRDPSRSEAFDPCCVLEDLYSDGTARAMLPWQSGLRMAQSDHLVLAREGGRWVGVIALSDRATPREPFLFIDAAYLAPVPRASRILQRMLAFAMLRLAGQEAVPSVIAACVQTPPYVSMLRGFGQRFSKAALFPATPEDIVIDLGMASLARRIVRVVRPGSRCESTNGTFYGAALTYAGDQQPMAETLVVVDLSTLDEASLQEEARKLYRARPSRLARRDVVPASTDEAAQPMLDATAG